MSQEAKLSAKQRRKLPSSAFCGPNRSFPVPDCKHARAALSLLGRYKGPGDRNKIRACIYRKAKAMNCFKSDKDSTEGNYSYAGALNELYMLFRDGMISNADVIAELSHFAHMASLSDEEISDIICRFVAGNDLFGAIRAFHEYAQAAGKEN